MLPAGRSRSAAFTRNYPVVTTGLTETQFWHEQKRALGPPTGITFRLVKQSSRWLVETSYLGKYKGVVERTMPHLSDVVADMIRFQLLTGARPGEVCMLSEQIILTSGS